MSHATAGARASRSGDVHAALASPVRQQLLDLLRVSGTPTDAHQLAQNIGLHVTTVRFHLEVLRRAGGNRVASGDSVGDARGDVQRVSDQRPVGLH